jgi:bifunctional enzyme CysN/CysC
MSTSGLALQRPEQQDVQGQHVQSLRIVIVGHVDHGKSTLVGRLLHETGSLPEGKTEALQDVCAKRGMPFEWAFVMDALQAERDQGITIDTSQIRFSSKQRDYVIIDAPGHKEFLKNMITGAASAEAAVLVIDAKDGVQEQSRRHGYLLHLLGLRQIAVAVNKMDAVGYDQKRFAEVEVEIRAYLAGIGVTPTHVVPIAARHGENLVSVSASMPWYKGPTIVGALDAFPASATPVDLPLRLPVQDVYKFDDRRIIAGRIESGRLKVGDKLVFSPSGKLARISSIEAWGAKTPVLSAAAGQSVGITLDEQIFVERGQVASLVDHRPVETSVFRARVFWLGKAPLEVGRRYKLKLNTAERLVSVDAIESVTDVADLATAASQSVERNAVAEIIFRARGQVALDGFADNPRTGRFVLVDGYDIVGGGVIVLDELAVAESKGTNLHATPHRVPEAVRWQANGHKGGIVWLTGLSGAGKSTIAMELERQLFRKGWQAYVLDGDNVRHGLCADLGFSDADRSENIRRVGTVANLFAEAGMVVITSFISPFAEDRDRVRRIKPERFHEIHVAADLKTCQARDPKGLYAKAAAGEIADMTGLTSPYEPPVSPELVLDTAGEGLEKSVATLLAYVEAAFRLEEGANLIEGAGI